MRKYDGPETVFFLDPPYTGTDGGVGEAAFDEGRFFEVLKSIKGKYLLTYGSKGTLIQKCRAAGLCVQQHFIKRNAPLASSVSGRPTMATFVVANFPLPDAASGKPEPFSKSVAILKHIPEERYLLGVVLEPDVVDAHNDVYGVDEVRKAAHGFMADFRHMGLMHRWKVNKAVGLVESYLLPGDTQIGNTMVRKGTWMLGVRVHDVDIWGQVRQGKLTGFSIGGFATREPLDSALSTESLKAGQPARIYQLTKMDVHEVSIIDFAANKQRFLIEKRRQDLAQNEDTETPKAIANLQPAEPPVVTPSAPPDSAGETNALLRELLAAVRDGAKSQGVTANADQPTPQPAAAEDTPVVPVEKGLGQRLTRLEKYFGLPNSEAPERPTGRRSANHSWPFDINRPGEDGNEGEGAQ